MRALVVDDSSAMRMILSRIMRDLGFEVFEAEHGRDGLERLRQLGRVDVALVDWRMPEMSGLEFVEAVRRERTWDDVPLMMVTTETELAQVRRALAAGVNEYVMKPFTKEAIREKLALLGIEQP